MRPGPVCAPTRPAHLRRMLTRAFERFVGSVMQNETELCVARKIGELLSSFPTKGTRSLVGRRGRRRVPARARAPPRRFYEEVLWTSHGRARSREPAASALAPPPVCQPGVGRGEVSRTSPLVCGLRSVTPIHYGKACRPS